MKNNILFMTIGLLVGIIAGFMFANSYNRGARAEVGQPPVMSASPDATTPASESDLTPDEIRAKLQEADKDPANIAFQRNLGLALYAYGASKEDASIIGEALRLLERVENSDAKDREVLVAMGNGHFDIGYFKKIDVEFAKAREYYSRALILKESDPNILVDVGLTFALTSKPEFGKAVEYYGKALDADPTHERTLQMMTDAQIGLGDKTKASEFLNRLRETNPSNKMISEFESKLSAK